MAGSTGWARHDSGPLRLGIDVGSVSVKAALVSADGRVIEWDYRRHLGQVGPTLAAMLQELVRRPAGASVGGVGITGTGGRTFAPSVGGILVNEVMAHLRAADHLTPAVQSIIDVGGQDARLVLLDRDAAGGVTLADFAMNSMCAAGTGSFLDQQASRLGVRIEGEFGELALRSHSAPRIAGPLLRVRQVGHDPPAAEGHARLRDHRRPLRCPRPDLPRECRQGQDDPAPGRVSRRRCLEPRHGCSVPQGPRSLGRGSRGGPAARLHGGDRRGALGPARVRGPGVRSRNLLLRMPPRRLPGDGWRRSARRSLRPVRDRGLAWPRADASRARVPAYSRR
jgi:hypothetical protein